MKKYILEAIRSKSKISIYFSSSKNDSFCYGEVYFCNDDFLLLGSFTPYGEDDGFLLKSVDEVIKIETDTKYCKKMEELIKYKQTKHAPFEVKGENITEQIFERSIKEHILLSILLYNSNEYKLAFITSFTGSICKAELINEYGEKDGNTVFNMDDVMEISFCSEDEKMLEILTSIKKTEDG